VLPRAKRSLYLSLTRLAKPLNGTMGLFLRFLPGAQLHRKAAIWVMTLSLLLWRQMPEMLAFCQGEQFAILVAKPSARRRAL